MRFSLWFIKLMYVNTAHGEFGEEYPLGTCVYRDILRDKEVKAALKKAWVAKFGPAVSDEDDRGHTEDCGEEL